MASDARIPAAPLISVAVCTRNRAGELRGALASLVGQTLHPGQFEILVIDNQSTDETPQVAEEFSRVRAALRRIVEPNIGLSHARNRAWRDAQGEYVAYIDDDARAPAEWLEGAARVIRERRPMIFGGPYRPFYSSPKPAWFKEEYGAAKTSLPEGPLPPREFLSGSNMFFRRELLAEMGGFDAEFGMRGGQVGYAEETELQARLRRERPEAEIYFSPALCVEHLVAPVKMTVPWLLRARFRAGRDAARALSARRNLPQAALRVLRHFARFAASLVAGAFARDRARQPYFMNWFYERSLSCLIEAGYAWGEASATPKSPKAR